MRRIVASLIFIVGLAGAAFAYDDPRALIEGIYQPYVAGQKHAGGLEQFYSTRLKELYAANAERQAVDHEGAAVDPDAPDMLNFDPFIEGQNPLLMDLAISEPVTSGDYAVATVSFHNFDHRSLLSLSLVREADGWKVDDVASLGGTENWLLSWLLQYDPFSVN